MPRSRLFLSCDLTGSTAFKQRSDHQPESPWQKAFLAFYREFPQRLELERVRLDGSDLKFELWKPVGDELLFSCEVGSEKDIRSAVTVWLAAMSAYEANSLDDTPMGVKGGAFIATFPGPDYESTIPRVPEAETSGRDVVVLNDEATNGRRSTTKFLFDYFGPSIDTGFRILSKCSARYFTLSLEVAYALSSLHIHTDGNDSSAKSDDLMFLDSIELKGVYGGNLYPVCALDLEANGVVNQAYRKFGADRYDIQNLHELCKAHYLSAGWPFKLYLPRGLNGQFQVAPTDELSEYVRQHAGSSAGAESVARDNPQGRELGDDVPTQ